MLVEEILEGYIQAWGRLPGGKMVRRYRCTSGKKKGRVVAKPTTCSTAVGQKASVTMKKTRRSRSRTQATKRELRMKHPTSKRIIQANKSLKFKRLRPRKRKKI